VKTKTLRDLWIDELKDLYNAEHQILKALPTMAKAASNDALRRAFEEHLEQSKGHVERLDQVFELIDQTPRGKKCKGLEGIIAEGKTTMEEALPESLGDVALIAAAQRVEHYEIAAYGTVRAFAEVLGETDAAELLNLTLDEEKATDETLSEIAEDVNPAAAEPELEPARSSSKNGNGNSKAKARANAGARR
jgi:ferritin-like metal-binding protein YciE